MNTFVNDFKSAFGQSGTTLTRLIVINVVVFVILLIAQPVLTLSGFQGIYSGILENLAMPAHITTFLYHPWTVITYFFTHEGFLHILFNMLNLYYFGQLIQEYLGSKKLVSLYILGGLMGGLLYLAAFNLIPYYESRILSSYMLGASGSVLAVIVAAATLLPDYTFYLFLFGPVRIKYIALVLVLLSVSGIIGGNAGGNLAHLGGALLGFVFIKQLQSGRDLGQPVNAFLNFVTGIFEPKPAVRITHRNPAPKPKAVVQTPYTSTTAAPDYGLPDQNEVDRILDKINRSGYDSLSKDEKQRLFRASQGN